MKSQLQTYCHKFGAKVKQLREEKGLTLQQLANQSDILASYIERVEKGETSSSHFARSKISKVLNVDLEPIATALYEESSDE